MPTALVHVAPELRFFLAARHRAGEVEVRLDGTSSLVHLIESLGIPRTEVGRSCVDDEPVDLRYQPQPGDSIEVGPVHRPQPVLAFRFLLDVHLGGLARRMRVVGLDSAYSNSADDPDLVRRATDEERVLLTRDRGLLRRATLPAGAFVSGDRPDDQLSDVIDRFAPPLAPWTRCPSCNGELVAVRVAEVAPLLEPGTLRSYTQFSRCERCGRPYWRGAHAGRLDALVAAARAGRDRS